MPIRHVWPGPGLLCLMLGALAAAPADAKNLHLIESLPSGFAIYRSGNPDSADVAEFCALGIQEIAVIAGNGKDCELRFREACPTLEVVYDERQDADEPLTAEFLTWFDRWVEEARRDGKKIAIRCECGCHRTGRLAAYYQIKYQNLTVEDALVLMYEYGKDWEKHKNLTPQVRALADYAGEKPCSQGREYCVQ